MSRIETTRCCLYRLLCCCFKRKKRLRVRDNEIAHVAQNVIAVVELPKRNHPPFDRRARFVSTEIVSIKRILDEAPLRE